MSIYKRKLFDQTLTLRLKVKDKVISNTFSIVKVFIFNFTQNLINRLEIALQIKDSAR